MDYQEWLKFIHIAAVIVFFSCTLGHLIWKTAIELGSHSPTLIHRSNRLLLAVDVAVILPSVIIIYTSGRWLAMELGLSIGGTYWIARSLFYLILSGLLWLFVLLPVEVFLLLRSRTPPRDAIYQRFFWLWLVVAVGIKVFPILALWLMVAKPT